MLTLNTFSVVAYDPQAQAFGAAVTTARPNVGSICPFVSLKGAIGTQARVNPDFGVKGLQLLEAGIPMDRALTVLLEQDEDRELRQLHGVDASGAFAFTGSDCVAWAGHHTEEWFSVAGNMLTGSAVISAMVEAMRHKQTNNLDLSERLIHALEAGQAAGGDKRGKQSAALVVASPNARWYHNLRVDDHADPVAELRRIHGVVLGESTALAKQYGEESLRLFGKVKW